MSSLRRSVKPITLKTRQRKKKTAWTINATNKRASFLIHMHQKKKGIQWSTLYPQIQHPRQNQSIPLKTEPAKTHTKRTRRCE